MSASRTWLRALLFLAVQPDVGGLLPFPLLHQRYFRIAEESGVSEFKQKQPQQKWIGRFYFGGVGKRIP